MADNAPPLVGLVPAAGRGTRIAPLPCSKEIYPVGFDAAGRSKAVCRYLLEGMHASAIETAYVILGAAKWDIPEHLGKVGQTGPQLAYLTRPDSPSTAHTLDRAYPFVRHARVALGFPDIIVEPPDALARVVAHQEASGADVVLGLFPAEQPHKCDMVELDAHGRVRGIVIKPTASELRYTWTLAVWTPTFSRFMHEYLENQCAASTSQELYVGDVIRAGMARELAVEAVRLDDGRFIDIGTPEDLKRALLRYAVSHGGQSERSEESPRS